MGDRLADLPDLGGTPTALPPTPAALPAPPPGARRLGGVLRPPSPAPGGPGAVATALTDDGDPDTGVEPPVPVWGSWWPTGDELPSLFDLLDDGDPGPIEPTDLPSPTTSTPACRSGRATSTCLRGSRAATAPQWAAPSAASCRRSTWPPATGSRQPSPRQCQARGGAGSWSRWCAASCRRRWSSDAVRGGDHRPLARGLRLHPGRRPPPRGLRRPPLPRRRRVGRGRPQDRRHHRARPSSTGVPRAIACRAPPTLRGEPLDRAPGGPGHVPVPHAGGGGGAGPPRPRHRRVAEVEPWSGRAPASSPPGAVCGPRNPSRRGRAAPVTSPGCPRVVPTGASMAHRLVVQARADSSWWPRAWPSPIRAETGWPPTTWSPPGCTSGSTSRSGWPILLLLAFLFAGRALGGASAWGRCWPWPSSVRRSASCSSTCSRRPRRWRPRRLLPGLGFVGIASGIVLRDRPRLGQALRRC